MAIYMQSLKEKEVKRKRRFFQGEKKEITCTEDFLCTCLYMAEFRSVFFSLFFLSLLLALLSFSSILVSPPSPVEYYSASMTESL